MMDDNRFDDFIGRAARELDPAPPVPRDAMWEAIAAARRAEAAAPVPMTTTSHATSAETAGTADPRVISIAGRNRMVPPAYSGMLRWGAPLAAMLIIGVGLGRLTIGTRTQTAVVNTTGAVASVDGTKGSASAPAAALNGAQSNAQNAGPTGDTLTTDARNLATLNRAPITGVAAPRTSASLARSVKRNRNGAAPDVIRENTLMRESDARNASAVVAFRMAALHHFERVQTLLVAVPSDARDGHINEIAVRAADLLVNTRLLLDSPAAKDQETHRLLDDLELILAQVATISPTHSAEDVDIIQDAITKRDVLLRLHAVTAGGRRLPGT